MSGDGRWQLQKKIYETLTTALATAGSGGAAVPVYDHVPQNAPFEYVAIGDGHAEEWDTSTELGQDHQVDIHVFGRNDNLGKKRVLAMQKLIYDALHDATLALDAGAALVQILCTLQTAFQEPDSKTWHGVCRFDALTAEA